MTFTKNKYDIIILLYIIMSLRLRNPDELTLGEGLFVLGTYVASIYLCWRAGKYLTKKPDKTQDLVNQLARNPNICWPNDIKYNMKSKSFSK